MRNVAVSILVAALAAPLMACGGEETVAPADAEVGDDTSSGETDTSDTRAPEVAADTLVIADTLVMDTTVVTDTAPEAMAEAAVDQGVDAPAAPCDGACATDQVCVQGQCRITRPAVGCTTCPCPGNQCVALIGGPAACCAPPPGETARLCVEGTLCPAD